METHENYNDTQPTQATKMDEAQPVQEDDTQVDQLIQEDEAQEQSQEQYQQSGQGVQEPSRSEEEWLEKLRVAEEEGYRRGLNERAAALMAEPAPYEPVATTHKVGEEIPFLKTIRRSVWDD